MSENEVPSQTPEEVSSTSPAVDETMKQMDPKLIEFMQRYQKAMSAWAQEHGNVNFPILRNKETGEYRWVNRAERRKMSHR